MSILVLFFIFLMCRFVLAKNEVKSFWNDTAIYIPYGKIKTLFKIPSGNRIFYWSTEIQTPGNYEFSIYSPSEGKIVKHFDVSCDQDRFYTGFFNNLDSSKDYEFQVNPNQNIIQIKQSFYAYGSNYDGWIMFRDSFPPIPPNMTVLIRRRVPIPPGCQNVTWSYSSPVENTLTLEHYQDNSHATTDILNGRDHRGVMYPPGKVSGYYELFIGSKNVDFVKVQNNAVGSIDFIGLNITCFIFPGSEPVPPHPVDPSHKKKDSGETISASGIYVIVGVIGLVVVLCVCGICACAAFLFCVIIFAAFIMAIVLCLSGYGCFSCCGGACFGQCVRCVFSVFKKSEKKNYENLDDNTSSIQENE